MWTRAVFFGVFRKIVPMPVLVLIQALPSLGNVKLTRFTAVKTCGKQLSRIVSVSHSSFCVSFTFLLLLGKAMNSSRGKNWRQVSE